MGDVATPGSADPERDCSEAAPRRSRWWAIGGAAVAAAFAVSVMVSTNSASVPVGASASMPGMSMTAGQLMATMRDVSDRTLRLPDSRPGVVVFAEARGCTGCVEAVRAARAAAARTTVSRPNITVLMTDSATSRADVRAFAQSVGGSPARYVVDDRNGTLASILGASSLPGAVVYDAAGRIVARPEPDARQMSAAIRRSGR